MESEFPTMEELARLDEPVEIHYSYPTKGVAFVARKHEYDDDDRALSLKVRRWKSDNRIRWMWHLYSRGVKKAEIARILDVDPSTVHRGLREKSVAFVDSTLTDAERTEILDYLCPRRKEGILPENEWLPDGYWHPPEEALRDERMIPHLEGDSRKAVLCQSKTC